METGSRAFGLDRCNTLGHVGKQGNETGPPCAVPIPNREYGASERVPSGSSSPQAMILGVGARRMADAVRTLDPRNGVARRFGQPVIAAFMVEDQTCSPVPPVTKRFRLRRELADPRRKKGFPGQPNSRVHQ